MGSVKTVVSSLYSIMEKLKNLPIKIAIGFGSITLLAIAIAALPQTENGTFAKSDTSVSIAPEPTKPSQTEIIKEATPEPTPETKPGTSPESSDPGGVPEKSTTTWDTQACDGNLAELTIAHRTACQFIQIGELKPQDIIYVGNKTDDRVEEFRTSGYEVYDNWKDFNPLTQRDISACVPYKDNSAACYKAVQADAEPENTEATPESKVYPSGMKCADFATSEEAQAALPTNPQLDKDGDGQACESLTTQQKTQDELGLVI